MYSIIHGGADLKRFTIAHDDNSFILAELEWGAGHGGSVVNLYYTMYMNKSIAI